MGNAAANAYFEASIPPRYQVPKDGDAVRMWERYIRDKYEQKKFVVPGSTLQAPGRRVVAEEAPAPAVPRPVESKPAPRPAVQQQVAAPSLLDFDAPRPAPAVPQQKPADSFGEFSAPSFGATPAANDFGSFDAAPQTQSDPFSSGFDAPAPPPAKAVPTTDSILSLYNTPPPQPAYPPQQMYPGQQYPPQMYGGPAQAAPQYPGMAPQYPPQQQYAMPPQQQNPYLQQPQQQHPGQYPGMQQSPAQYQQPMPTQQYYPPVPNVPAPYMGGGGYPQQPQPTAPYGQAPYGQAPYGQAPYGQAPYAGTAQQQQQKPQEPSMGIDPFASFKR